MVPLFLTPDHSAPTSKSLCTDMLKDAPTGIQFPPHRVKDAPLKDIYFLSVSFFPFKDVPHTSTANYLRMRNCERVQRRVTIKRPSPHKPPGVQLDFNILLTLSTLIQQHVPGGPDHHDYESSLTSTGTVSIKVPGTHRPRHLGRATRRPAPRSLLLLPPQHHAPPASPAAVAAPGRRTWPSCA